MSLSAYGDGTVKGIISVDISEWEEPGLNGKAAKDCTPEEIKAEVWEQLKRSVNYGDVRHPEGRAAPQLEPRSRASCSRARGHDGERGAVARQSRRHVEASAGGRDEDSESVPGVRLRPHLHRSGDHGGGQRSGSARGQRHPRRRRVRARRGAACGTCTSPRSSRPWRELDLIRYTQGLPWDDTLVRFGLSFAELADKAIQALESGSERARARPAAGRLSTCRSPHHVRSAACRRLVSRARARMSDLPGARRQRRSSSGVVRLLAIRLAEAAGQRAQIVSAIHPRRLTGRSRSSRT